MKKTLVLCLVSIILGLCNAAEYIPNTILLERDGKEVKWGQSTNDKGSCSPSYNALCPRTDNENNKDDCDRMLAGCGAIAMAQIMWKWAYPDESRYGIYDWDKMPSDLIDGCSTDCPKLISDCGKACKMNYQSIGGFELPVIFGTDMPHSITNLNTVLKSHSRTAMDKQKQPEDMFSFTLANALQIMILSLIFLYLLKKNLILFLRNAQKKETTIYALK